MIKRVNNILSSIQGLEYEVCEKLKGEKKIKEFTCFCVVAS